MTIQVKRASGTRMKAVSGIHRLSSQLAVNGKAYVQDIETGDYYAVHRVAGKMVMLTSPVQAAA